MKTNDPLEPLLKEAKSVIRKRIVVLTGAGVSAESGVSTFRDSNGLWENHRVEEVASIDDGAVKREFEAAVHDRTHIDRIISGRISG